MGVKSEEAINQSKQMFINASIHHVDVGDSTAQEETVNSFIQKRVTTYSMPPQWGVADAEIKVPSAENTELKRSPFKTWSSQSVYSHTCYAYCQGFLLCLFLPYRTIHLHFFRNLSRFFPVANTGSCVGPQNKIGHPARCRLPCLVSTEYK